MRCTPWASETVARIGGKGADPHYALRPSTALSVIFSGCMAIRLRKNPTAIVLGDRGMQIALVGWGTTVIAIIYGFGGDLGGLLE